MEPGSTHANREKGQEDIYIDGAAMSCSDTHLGNVLALEVQQGRFGCAVFCAAEHQLLLCEDQPFEFALESLDTSMICEGDQAERQSPTSASGCVGKASSDSLIESRELHGAELQLRHGFEFGLGLAELREALSYRARGASQTGSENENEAHRLDNHPLSTLAVDAIISIPKSILSVSSDVAREEQALLQVGVLMDLLRIAICLLCPIRKHTDLYHRLTDTHMYKVLSKSAEALGNVSAIQQNGNREAEGRSSANKSPLQQIDVNESLHVVYFPQIGYLIVVPDGDTVNLQADRTLEHQFSSESSVYFKNARMIDMDRHLGDLASFIVDREIEILDGLHTFLLGSCRQLIEAHHALTELDCLLAFSRAALIYDLRRPVLNDHPVLRLEGCRHPLKALSDDNFVPNDIELWGGYGSSETSEEGSEMARDAATDEKQSVMVLTGACMSQCGSFVPAARAELGVFDKVLTRMRQDESVASEGSSFTRELGRLSQAISCSTSRSLVLLDEVGRECRSDVYLPTLDTANTLTCLYRLKPGFAGSSHACHCAMICGVPENVVKRAAALSQHDLQAWQDARALNDEAIIRRFLQLDFEELRKETADVNAAELLDWVLNSG
nr:DNA mismatch repair protein [Tranzscheliella williamsii]